MSDTELLVLILLEEFACTPDKKPNLQSHLFEDLGVGDDPIDFIAEIENQIGIKIPASEWENVEFAKDIVKLIDRHIRSN